MCRDNDFGYRVAKSSPRRTIASGGASVTPTDSNTAAPPSRGARDASGGADTSRPSRDAGARRRQAPQRRRDRVVPASSRRSLPRGRSFPKSAFSGRAGEDTLRRTTPGRRLPVSSGLDGRPRFEGRGRRKRCFLRSLGPIPSGTPAGRPDRKSEEDHPPRRPRPRPVWPTKLRPVRRGGSVPAAGGRFHRPWQVGSAPAARPARRSTSGPPRQGRPAVGACPLRLREEERTRMDCYVCEGHGEWVCPACRNTPVPRSRAWPRIACRRCGGIGYVICPTCGGTGYLEQRE